MDEPFQKELQATIAEKDNVKQTQLLPPLAPPIITPPPYQCSSAPDPILEPRPSYESQQISHTKQTIIPQIQQIKRNSKHHHLICNWSQC